MDLGQNIISTLAELETQRQPLESQWRDCFDLTAPERGQGFYNQTDGYQLDTSKRAELYDSTGTDSVQMFASALTSGLTPSNSKWFQLELEGVSTDVLAGASRIWLQESSEKMFGAFNSSNFHAVLLEFKKDIAIAGMSGLYIDMDSEGKLIFEEWPLYNLYVQESQRNRGIDTVYRRMQLTPAQAFNLFGDNIPESAKHCLETKTKLSETDEYVHCIMPREGKTRSSEAKLVKNMPFASVYVHVKTKQIVKESGFNEMPVIIPRWSVIPDTSYAIGPFYKVLPDMKSLNEIQRIYLTNLELGISPPLVADDDGVINPNNIKLGPREVMFKSQNGDIRPLYVAGDLSTADVAIVRLQTSIRRQMMADQLAGTGQKYDTAQAIMQKQETMRALFGPLFGRLESEYLRPMLERVFGLMYRAGLLGEPPEELLNMDFKPSFTGPHARAQRMERANVTMNYVQNLMVLAQTDPTVMDAIDLTKTALRYGELTGVEQDLIRTQREIDQLREQRQQQQQAMAAMQAQLPPSEAA